MNGRVNKLGKIKARLSNDFVLFDLFSATFVLASLADLFPDHVARIVIITICIAIGMMLIFKKRTDEFSTECWRSATTMAFALVIVGPYFSGFIDGFIGELRNDPNYRTVSENILWVVQVALFIFVFQFKRVRGSFA
jgi:hypothetical protein